MSAQGPAGGAVPGGAGARLPGPPGAADLPPHHRRHAPQPLHPRLLPGRLPGLEQPPGWAPACDPGYSGALLPPGCIWLQPLSYRLHPDLNHDPGSLCVWDNHHGPAQHHYGQLGAAERSLEVFFHCVQMILSFLLYLQQVPHRFNEKNEDEAW